MTKQTLALFLLCNDAKFSQQEKWGGEEESTVLEMSDIHTMQWLNDEIHTAVLRLNSLYL